MGMTKQELERYEVKEHHANREIKRIRVSPAHQITIPQNFYEKLKIGNEVDVELTNDAIVIRPVQEEVDFSKEIIADMIKENVPQYKFVEEFERRKSQIRPAVEKMVEDADQAVERAKADGYVDETSDLFGDLDDDK